LLILSSDSLLRHLAKHGNVFKPNPSGRSKRACITCHAGKTKCDGNEKCSTCLKKGLECRYRTQDEIQPSASSVEPGDQIAWQGSTSPRSPAKEQEPSDASNANTESLRNSALLPPGPDEPPMGVLADNSTQQPLSLTSSSLFRAPNVNGLVDWSAVKIRNDSNVRNDPQVLDPELEVLLDTKSEKHLELYYVHFHHRWPLIHRPSLEEETPVSIMLSSMIMIGAWLEGSREAKKRALDSHEKLVSGITSQLVCIPYRGFNQNMVSAN
jgi:hypothetical protein